MRFFQLNNISVFKKIYDSSFSSLLVLSTLASNIKATLYNDTTLLCEDGIKLLLSINENPQMDQCNTKFSVPSLLTKIFQRLSECSVQILPEGSGIDQYNFTKTLYSYVKHVRDYVDNGIGGTYQLCWETNEIEYYAKYSQNISSTFKNNATECIENIINDAYNELVIETAEQQKDYEDYYENFLKQLGIGFGLILGIIALCCVFGYAGCKISEYRESKKYAQIADNDKESIEMETKPSFA